MKIAALYTVWNETDYLKYSLLSVKEYVDYIIVVAARDRFGQKSLNNGPCNDGGVVDCTLIGSRYEFLFLGDVNDLMEARNEAIARVPVDIDWIWLVDGDEVYHPSDVEKLLQLLSTTDADLVHLRFHHFVLSFEMKDRVESHVERVYRNIPGMKYVRKHNVMSYPDGTPMEDGQKVVFPDCYFFHYGYVKPLPLLLMKMKRQFLQRVDLFGEINQYRRPVNDEIIFRLNNWYNPAWLEKATVTFDLGRHPAVMKDHRWYGKDWKKVYLDF